MNNNSNIDINLMQFSSRADQYITALYNGYFDNGFGIGIIVDEGMVGKGVDHGQSGSLGIGKQVKEDRHGGLGEYA